MKTKQILCPHCVELTGKYPSMLCAEDENGDIIIRCKRCKTDVNVSEIQRAKKGGKNDESICNNSR